MKIFPIILLLSIFMAPLAMAREFRRLNTIPVAAINSTKPAQLQQAFKPIGIQQVEEAVREIVASWNTVKLKDKLDDRFTDKAILLATIQRVVPMDAQLRMLSVRNISTLEQNWQEVGNTSQRQLESIVVATVEIQMEFNDPLKGQVRLAHTSQFYLRVTEAE